VLAEHRKLLELARSLEAVPEATAAAAAQNAAEPGAARTLKPRSGKPRAAATPPLKLVRARSSTGASTVQGVAAKAGTAKTVPKPGRKPANKTAARKRAA
jgi:hypothetical protein